VPPRFLQRAPTRTTRLWGLALLVAEAASLYGLLHAGRFLAREDPLATADAIFVLAGTRVERTLEAADLYSEHYARTIVLTRVASEQGAVLSAARRGAHVATDVDISRQLLRDLGIPVSAIIVADRLHDNTAEEAQTLRELAIRERWTRVIAVSSKYHLRRVALATRRALRGTTVQVIVRGSRYDPATPDRWWQRRGDIRWLASEVPKLVAYAAGAGG
jgi:uncharacterized SAM-binding protein YcdF (DUF218 family)